MADKPMLYGGQAVIEGVMFGGKKVTVTAIRRKDQSIDFYQEEKKEPGWVRPFKKTPFIRGIVALIYSAANGAKHLNFASERYDVDPSEDEKLDNEKNGGSTLTLILGVAVVGVLSLLFGKLLFTALPAVLASLLFDQWVNNLFLNNLLEGGIKVILLVTYILAISQTPIIKRLFQYHGAEHKVINAYEAGVKLTVENVQRFSTLHYRCGSSFMVFTVLVGVVIYSFFPYETIWDRVFIRILLLPVVIGVSYETLQFTNLLRDIPLLRVLGYPGLWLQKLTTREPDDYQVEVAIASFEKMREADQQLEQEKAFVPQYASVN